MTADQRAMLVEHRLADAAEALAAGRVLLDAQSWTAVVNRAYYAAFYAGSAMLAHLDVQVRRHTGVQAEIHRRLVHTGRLNPRFGAMISRLLEQRLEGDYADLTTVTPESAGQALADASEFVAEMRRLLSQSPPLEPT